MIINFNNFFIIMIDIKLYYIVITESVNVKNSKDGNGEGDNKNEKKVEEYRKYKIKLLPEDFNKFMTVMTEVINHIKTDLMPQFDYDKYN